MVVGNEQVLLTAVSEGEGFCPAFFGVGSIDTDDGSAMTSLSKPSINGTIAVLELPSFMLRPHSIGGPKLGKQRGRDAECIGSQMRIV
jgi:hypothetical protein